MRAPIVMVHGAFCGGWVFDRFRTPFEAAGRLVLTPDLRGHEAGAPAGAVAGLSMARYAADIAAICEGLAQPPILVGHSMGGLVVQMAALRTPVAGLILLAPSPPWGGGPGSVEEAMTAFGLHMLGPYWARAVPPDRTLTHSYCLDRMERAEREATYGQMVSESGRAIFETLNWWLDPFMTTAVDAARLKAPVLTLAGGCDLIHPPRTVKATASRLGGDFESFPNMSHWLPAEPGWQAVAQTAVDWSASRVSAAA